MRKVLLILAEGFEEIEAVAPIDLLRRAGVEVCVAGLSSLTVKSARGLAVTADKILKEVSEPIQKALDMFDALILPGGAIGAKNLASSAQIKSLLQEFHRNGKWIAAICASPVLVLNPTGILNGKSATCFTGMEGGFNLPVIYRDQKVVVDSNVITSQGPGTAIEFSLTLIEKLIGTSQSHEVRGNILL